MDIKPSAALFNDNYDVLFGIAYRILGSRSDCEDILQDAWLRWSRKAGPVVRNPAAYLSTIVTRLCLDQLRKRKIEKLNYVGVWLPEPLLTEDTMDDRLVQDETLGMALLVALESLNPMERAVFVLGEAFDYSHAEISNTLGITACHSRQLLRRARSRLAMPKSESNGARDNTMDLVSAFFEAAQSGDIESLKKLLADDVVAYSDGGGKATAALIPLEGQNLVITVFSHLINKNLNPRIETNWIRVNGQWGLKMTEGDLVHSVSTFELESGKLRRIYIIRNPDKLRGFYDNTTSRGIA